MACNTDRYAASASYANTGTNALPGGARSPCDARLKPGVG